MPDNRRHIIRLRAMLEHQRNTLAVYDNANGQNYRDMADKMRDNIDALRWALLQLDPQKEQT